MRPHASLALPGVLPDHVSPIPDGSSSFTPSLISSPAEYVVKPLPCGLAFGTSTPVSACSPAPVVHRLKSQACHEADHAALAKEGVVDAQRLLCGAQAPAWTAKRHGGGGAMLGVGRHCRSVSKPRRQSASCAEELCRLWLTASPTRECTAARTSQASNLACGTSPPQVVTTGWACCLAPLHTPVPWPSPHRTPQAAPCFEHAPPTPHLASLSSTGAMC